MLHKYYPTPSCRMGALFALSEIRDVVVVEFGPAGTTHFSLEGIANFNGEALSHAYTTHIRERDLTFGDTARLEAALREIDRTKAPRVVFVMASTLSSVIGIDIASVCEMMQPEIAATLVPLKSDGYRGDYTYGVEEVLLAVAEHIVKAATKKCPMTYNIVGSQMDGYTAKSDVKALRRLMRDIFGAQCHTVFTSGTTYDALENAGCAELNLCLRREAAKACRLLEEKCEQPFVTQMPYGVENLARFVSEVEAATGWKRDEGVYRQMMLEGKRLTRRLSAAFEVAPKKVLVSGNVDTVVGVLEMLTESGVSEVFGLVNHKVKGKECRPYPVANQVSEAQKMETLKTFGPDIVLGDGVLLTMGVKHGIFSADKGMQISNPNMNRVLLHHEVPLVGIDGMRVLAENLLNRF